MTTLFDVRNEILSPSELLVNFLLSSPRTQF